MENENLTEGKWIWVKEKSRYLKAKINKVDRVKKKLIIIIENKEDEHVIDINSAIEAS